jgi:hypothetical protein
VFVPAGVQQRRHWVRDATAAHAQPCLPRPPQT